MITCLNNLKQPNGCICLKLIKEVVAYFILFFLSFLNNITLTLFLLLLLLLFSQKELGAIKIILLVSLRGLINPGIAVQFTGIFSIIKYIYLFLPSIYLLFCSNFINNIKNKDINKLLLLYFVLFLYIIFQSMLFSSYPIISISKFISYAFIFVSIIIGLKNTNIQEVFQYFKIWIILIFIASIPLYFFEVGYLRNGHAFQGLINHPNIYGVFCSLVLTIVLISDYNYKGVFIKIFYAILSMTCIYLSESRTAMFTAVFSIACYMFYSNKINLNTKIVMILCVIFGIPLLSMIPRINDLINDFILKGYDNIFFSRSNQIQMFIEKMKFNALFGTGFLTPFVPYKQQFIFSFNYVVEDGNILLATLGYIGIIGFIIIAYIYYFIFSRNRDKKYIVLFFVPILISFGEMTFYSSNNMACLFYICYGIYFYSGINIFKKHSQKCLNIQKKNDI